MAKAMFLFLLVIVLAGWFILRPGLFFIPPTTYEPEGVVLIYYEKQSGMPFFSSPASLCASRDGEVTPACLATGEDTAGYLSRRLITRLPYAEWAYELFLPQR